MTHYALLKGENIGDKGIISLLKALKYFTSLKILLFLKENLDQRKNPKWQVSSYFNNHFSPISSPCGRL